LDLLILARQAGRPTLGFGPHGPVAREQRQIGNGVRLGGQGAISSRDRTGRISERARLGDICGKPSRVYSL